MRLAKWILVFAALININPLAHAQANKPVRLGLSPWPGWFVWFWVRDGGFFAKHGVNVELVWFPVYSDSLQAFATGQVDGNSQTLSDTVVQAAKGVPLRIVLVNDISYGADALIARPQYQTVKDLKGKTVATELGTVDHFLLLQALRRNGLKERDIRLVNMTINDAGPAFIAGKLDAAVLWEPFLSKALTEGKGKILFSSRDTPGLIPDLLVFNQRAIRERPGEIGRILAAWFDALEAWRREPEKALTVMARYAAITVEEYRRLLSGVKVYTLEDNLAAFEMANSWRSLAQTGQEIGRFLQNVGYIQTVPKVSDYLEPSFVRAIRVGGKR